jgi:hypothetical protein
MFKRIFYFLLYFLFSIKDRASLETTFTKIPSAKREQLVWNSQFIRAILVVSLLGDDDAISLGN